MQRLLQGDVGSGKTVVAALAALQALENGYQVAVMAPTEILAEQHFRKFADGSRRSAWRSRGWPAACSAKKNAQALARSRVGRRADRDRHARAVPGRGRVPQLGLAIVDEQHRFGVRQRLALRLKGSTAGAPPSRIN